MNTRHNTKVPGQYDLEEDDDSAPAANLPATVEQLQAQLLAERAERRELRKQRDQAMDAAYQAGAQLNAIELITEHGKHAIATSQHRHMTADECLREGITKVVLAKDGWYVPPVLRVN